MPRIGVNILRVFRSVGGDPDAKREELKRVFRHELGHFLGLADYGHGCWRLIDDTATVQASLMSYGQLQDRDGNPLLQPDGPADPTALDPPGCRSAMIETRDLDDLHAIYHPDAVTGLTLRHNADGSSVLSWSPPAGTPSEYNAASLGIFQRALLTRDTATGAPAGPGPWGLLVRIAPTEDDHMLPDDVGGYEYAVAGLTSGDHRRGSDIGPAGLRHGHVDVPLPDPPGGSVSWTLGEASNIVSAPAPVGVYALSLPIANYGAGRSGQWAFAAWGRTVTDYQPQHGGPVSIAPGDLIVSYGQPFTSLADSPFAPASFTPLSIRYGTATVTLASCDTHFWNNGRYECHVQGAFTWQGSQQPLRLIVTAAGSAPADPLSAAGTYELIRHRDTVADFGVPGIGKWRFAFWGHRVEGYRPQHGGPVTIDPGDIVLSLGQPYTSFAASPFDPSSFTPLRIQYGATTITATSCDTHFWNNGRYECHIRGAFTWDAANIPSEVTVNRAAASARAAAKTSTTGTDTDRGESSGGPPTPPPTYLTTCPTWSNLTCGQPGEDS